MIKKRFVCEKESWNGVGVSRFADWRMVSADWDALSADWNVLSANRS
ncbi:hypothetical protein [Neobacillus bataviensis]|nr:hypothetical protein [Neobacillus bataviensis]